MPDGRPVPGSFWFYAPTHGAPVFFAVAFAASAGVHLWQCMTYKTFRVTAYLPFCCTLFAAGFALREYGAFHYDNVNVYLASTLLIYMSPPILELANYHILGRTLYYVPYCASIHPGRVLSTLGALSAAVEILNALGLGVIALFYGLAARFHARCRAAGVASPRVRAVLCSLVVSMGLILVRTVYRAVEHFGQRGGGGGGGGVQTAALSPVVRYEWFFYVLEAAPMLVNTAMWNARHPGRYLPRSFRVYLAQDGATEVSGPGWRDKRSVVMTVVDPFGLVAMCEKGNRGEPFWEENGYHHLLRGRKEQSAV
ncbi:hypothetical protein BT67DRAFT_451541 [Trichocladium antarcticum]|uniref:Uncharacterized protein n=1 Tax=Trichocladium antarcticum TaxID=1450529 RepID=A0AAN6UEQ2_9PEZI|nr:hypothetical protein BT67DRAFT_451541 [Trichocladium antarcticum]